MRRTLYTLASLSFVCLGLAGCHHPKTHGVCDCYQPDPCCTRAPWVTPGGPPPYMVPPTAPAGTGVPPVEVLPQSPKKL